MFDALIIGYLFLGGVGGGLLSSLSALELLRVARRKGIAGIGCLSYDHTVSSWSLCLAILGLAITCLLFDIGRPDRVLNVFLLPSFTPLTVGSFSLLLSVICAAVFMLAKSLKPSSLSRHITILFSGIGLLAGIITAVYTGFLLESLASIVFWNSTFLSVLFLLSSLSTGIAGILMCSALPMKRNASKRTIRFLAKIDIILIGAELLCLTFYLLAAYLNPDTTVTARALLFAELSWLFWPGLVIFGLVVPLIMEIQILKIGSQKNIHWIAILVLIGGLVLRVCIVEAAAFDVTQIPTLYNMAGGLGS